MATNTTSLNVIKWAYIDQTNPDTHYNVDPSATYQLSDQTNKNKMLLYGLESVPTELRRYRILGVEVSVNPVGFDYAYFSSLFGGFDSSTITWNSGKPEMGSSYLMASRSSGQADAVRSEEARAWLDPTVNMTLMQQIIQNGGFVCRGNAAGYSIRPALSNGRTNAVKVTYDTEAVLHGCPVIVDAPTGTVDPRKAITFSWKLQKHASNWYCMDETFIQTSAKFYWKFSDDENWTVINLTDQMSVTIPANTLPTAKTVQWYVETTDEDGVTDRLYIQSFQTPINIIYFKTRPSGTEVDIRYPIVFSWVLSSVIGNYDQQSATLYWRKSVDDSWTAITTGSQQTIVVPALTFPTYATITWYLEATDTGGHTAVYNQSQFSTPTVVIEPYTFPDGSDISTKVAHSFEWRYTNSKYTDYTQDSAEFYWQKVPSETWNKIDVSGNIKTLSIPANTFPTSSKIRWYISGTDVGGTTTRTSLKEFETVTTKITPQNCPTSGYYDPRNEIVFSWYYSSLIGEYTQRSAVLYWREVGDDVWNEIPVSGNVQTITIPANTFPVASNIQWYLAGTDTGGTTTTTEQFTFSTTASTAYAVCISPVGQVEDGTKQIVFSWIVKNDDGSLPLRTVIEWKYDTESQLEWKTLLDTVDTSTEFVAQAETFHAGAIEWRVSAYNRDLIQGPTNVASFVCLHSPEAPAGLAATPVPRTLVRWQSSGQEAYEVMIDGAVVAKAYGPSVYSYQQNEPLEDGEHTISVRVQGQYGLWSNYSETTILVHNVPGASISLSGVFDIDTQLVWSVNSQDQNSTMNVYRDGKWIATLIDSFTFADRFAVGTHSYYVELWESSGNYTRSNTIDGTIEVKETVIADIAGSNWMNINLTETSNYKGNYTWQKEFAIRNVLGSEYPIIEVGKNISMIGNFACAFSDNESALQFEKFRGKHVIIKTHGNNIISGVIVNMNKQVLQFYTNYSFTLQQTSLEDFISNET
jgi:hypothetical protein